MRHGALNLATGTNPAAAAEISQTVPTGKWWKLLAIKFTLVADANVANREVDLILDDGTSAGEFARIGPLSVQTAGLTQHYTYGLGLQMGTIPLTSTAKISPLPDLYLGPGYRFRTTTQNIQAGDDLSAPVFYYLETAVHPMI